MNDLGGKGHGTGSGDAADGVVTEIPAAGGTAIANKVSVSSREGSKSIVDAAFGAFGIEHILVNNAGILRDKSFKHMSLDDWDIAMNVHLNGSAYVAHAVWLPCMRGTTGASCSRVPSPTSTATSARPTTARRRTSP